MGTPSSPQDFTAVISVNGQKYSAWESVMVRRDFGNPITQFQFTPLDGSYGPGFQGMKISPGDTCSITLGGLQAFNGWCTVRAGALDASAHQLVIIGESFAADLARSSVIVQPGNFNGYSFQQAASAVMAPHPLQLVMGNMPSGADKPFANLSVQPGETVAEFVSRIALMRGLFLSDDVNGNLVAGQGDTGGPVATLIEGQNIKRLTWHLEDPSARVSNRVSGSSQTPATDGNNPTHDISATATNSNIRPNRFNLFVAEHPGDAQDLVQRVNHEVAINKRWTVRIGVTVVGWKKPDGSLWMPAKNVSLYSPSAFPTAETYVGLAIQSCTYTQDPQNGTETTMELVRVDALSSTPNSELPNNGGGGQPAQPDPSDTSMST